MRFICGLLILLLPGTLASQPLDRALSAIDDPPRGAKASLLAANITVIGDMGSYLLVLASRDDLSRIAAMGLDAVVLDVQVVGKTYYTISSRTPLARDVGEGIRILRHDGYHALIEAAPARAERLVTEGIDIARVFLRPIRPQPAEKPERAVTQPDPIVEALVDSVSSPRIDAAVGRLQDFVTRHSTRDSCQAAANYIKAQFESFGIDSVYFHHWSETYKDNVVAVIPGVGDAEKIVLIGGHYDSVTGNFDFCPGADDNASGTAGVLECARVLATQQFDATIKFVAFCGEEQGLLGSAAYANDAAANGDDIIAMINVDMIGYLAPGDVLDLDIIDNEDSTWLRDLVMSVGELYVPELPLVDGTLPATASSDHGSFWNSGYDAIMFYEDSGSASPYIHTANDVVGVSYVSSQLAERSVKVAVALLATIAEPFRVAIRHTPLADVEDPHNPHRVTAEVITSGTLATESMFVHYGVGGVADSVPLTYTGLGDVYEGYLPAQPAGSVVDYYLVAANTDGYRTSHPKGAPSETHQFVVGTAQTIVVDDFETDTGWVVGDTDDDATSGIWERVDPNGTSYQGKQVQPEDDHTPDPGVTCFVTGNAPPFSTQAAADVDNGKTTLFSPVFDLSAYDNAWVSYYRWYTNDTGGNQVTDIWAVDVSADSGQSWQRMETLASSNRSWYPVEKNLLDFISLTSQVQFRFIASDYDFTSIVEAAIDDFAIVTYVDSTTVAGKPPTLPPGFMSLSHSFPNPFNPETRIRVQIGGAGERVTLRIYDVAGRAVTTLLDHEFVEGERIVAWDGRDLNGRAVASGVYFYRLDAGGRHLSRKVVVLR